jgi:uncharacterized protein involved in outer membrane biogenesis
MMRRFIKYCLIFVLVMMLIMIAGMFVAVKMVDPNQFKPLIAKQVKAATGRDLTIDGDIQWGVFPSLRLNLPQVRLTNGDGRAADPLASAENVIVTVKTSTLLEGKIVLNGIKFNQLKLHLRVDKTGHDNWQLPTPKPVPASQKQVGAKQSRYFTELDISSMKLNNGSIDFLNAQTGQHAALQKINFTGDMSLSSFDKPIPDALKMGGNLSVDQLTFNKLKASNLQATLSLNKGKWVLHPMSMNFYQGTITAQATVDFNQGQPQLIAQQWIKNINAKALFDDLGHTKRINGDFNAELSEQAQSLKGLPGNLNGLVSFEFKNGVIEGVDINHLIEQAVALVSRKPQPEAPSQAQTPFLDFNGKGTIKNGVLDNDQLMLNAKVLKVTGKGSINFVNNKIDYHLLAMRPEPKVKVVGHVQEILGGGIPLRVVGTYQDYKIKLDTPRLTKAAAEYLLRKESKRLEGVGKDIEKKGKKLFNNIFER